VAANLAPGKDDLSGCSALLLGDSLDLRPGDKERDVEEVVAKGGVGGNMNVLLLGIGDELLAGKDRVALDLVDGRDKSSLLNQSLEVLVCEVRYTDGADLALRELVYSLPCFTVGDRVVDVDLIGIGSGREEVRVRVLSWAKVDGPVDEVEVEIVELELSKGIIESSLDVLRVVLGVPELGCDEDVLTLEAGNVLEGTLDALSNFLLVLVADWCKKC
jgi:hypothetical protein